MSFAQGPLADALGDIVLEEEEADLMALQGTIIFKCVSITQTRKLRPISKEPDAPCSPTLIGEESGISAV